MDKTYYVYKLTYVVNGVSYYYVGKHSWLGTGYDSSYDGSSHVARHNNWKSVSHEVLEWCTAENVGKRETYWISHYAALYGIADCALVFSSNSWTSMYKPHGRLLNCQAQDCANAIEAARDPSVVERRVQTQIDKYNGLPCNTAQASAKEVETKKRLGQYEDMPWNSPEIREKVVSKIHYSSTIEKAWETRRGTSPVFRTIECEGIQGSPRFVCGSLGNPNWAIAICRKFSQGSTEVEHHGHTFKLVNSK